jgi:hypothetical protein
MSLGEKTRKLFLKLGFTYLPLLGLAGATAAVATKINSDAIVISSDNDVRSSEKERYENKIIGYSKKALPIYGILAGISLLGTYGLYASRKRRLIMEQHRGADKIFDYPMAVSSAGAVASLGAAVSLTYSGNMDLLQGAASREPLLVGALTASGLACLNYVYYVFADRISALKSPCLKNTAKIFGLVFKSREEREKKGLELFAEENTSTFADRAEVAFNEGRKLDSLYYYNASLQQLKRRSEFEEALATSFLISLARKITSKLDMIQINSRLKKDPDNIGLLTDAEYNLLLTMNEKGTRDIANRIISLPHCSNEDKLLQSFILDYVGDKSHAEAVRNNVLHSLFLEKRHARIGRELLYQKHGTQARLFGESMDLSDLQKYCAKYDFEAARPLGIFGEGENSVLFETFSDGVPLFDYLEHNSDFEVLRKAARTQSVLHGLMKREGDYFLKDDISSFLGSVPDDWALDKGSLNNALSALLMPAVRFLAPDCDGHRMNRHYNETRQITVYDLEPRGLAPVPFDYAKLLRQGRLIGSWQQQKDLLAECADNFNSLARSSQRMDVGSFAENVLRSSPYKALRYASFAWSKPEINKAALTFLDNAKNDMYIIKNENLLDLDRFRAVADAVKVAYNALIEQSARIQPMTSH